MQIYSLKGEKVTLSNDLDMKHAPELARLANDREIFEKLAAHTFPHPYTVESARDFFDMNREDGASYFAIDFLVFAGEKLAGAIGLKDINRIDLNAQIGYWIGREFWNNGYASEALSLMLKFSREELDLVRLYAKVLDCNLPSLRVLLKNGFVVEGFEKNAFRMEDGFHSFFLAAKLFE